MVGPPVALMLEIVEGPGAGHESISRPSSSVNDAADLVIEDSQASRRRAHRADRARRDRRGPEVHERHVHQRQRAARPLQLGPDDELLIGVTVMVVRTPQQVERQPSAVRAVPAFAAPESRPTFTEPVRGGSAPPTDSGVPELERLRDSRVKTKASLAPLTIFVLAALAVVIYLGVT